MDGIPGVEELAPQNILSALLSFKLKRENSELCGFVRANISLAIVRSNSLLLRCPTEKYERIRNQPKMLDRNVMALLVPW